MRIFLIMILLFSSCSNLEREVLIKSHKHFYIAPRGPGLKPALVLAPDCFGLSPFFKEKGNQLADLGFHILVLDLNGEGKNTTLPGESENLCEKQELPKEIIKEAIVKLKSFEGVDGKNISALGYAHGADLLFDLAREGTPFENLILVQGSLKALRNKSSFVDTKVLVLNAALDPSVNSRIIGSFKKELRLNQLTYEFISYSGARKGFYWPGATKLGDDFDLPYAYDKKADMKSIDKINNFLKNTLR